jgi:hypothetical protein
LHQRAVKNGSVVDDVKDAAKNGEKVIESELADAKAAVQNAVK